MIDCLTVNSISQKDNNYFFLVLTLIDSRASECSLSAGGLIQPVL